MELSGLLRLFRCALLIVLCLPTAPLCAQLTPTLVGGTGANRLVGAGAGIDPRIGMSNYVGVHITLGNRERTLSFRPTLNYAWGYYRTRVTDLVDHRTMRSALQLDLLLVIRAGEYGAWVLGPFGGAVLSSSGTFNRIGGGNVPAFGQQAGNVATSQAGVVLGYSVQLGTSGRWDMDLRARQHLVGLVWTDHHYTVSNGPQELLMTATARALELTVGLGWRIGSGEAR